MTTLVTDQQFKFGKENIIPFAGKVQISDKGEIQVEDDIAQSIVDCNCGFYLQEHNQTTTTTTIVETTTTTTTQIGTPVIEELSTKVNTSLQGDEGQDALDINSNADTTQIQTTIDLEVARQELDKSTLAELKEIAKDFPSTEWRSLNKAELIDYLILKIA